MKQLQTLILLLLSAVTFAQSEQMTVPLSNPASPGTLKVNLISGSISIKGGTNKEVIIDAEIKERKENGSNEVRSDGMRRISANKGFEITANEKNNTVSVGTGNPNQKMNLSIQVPANFSLKISTINNGDISIENVNGNMEISNINGKITLTNVSGSAISNTINGDIRGNFKTITGDTPMAFTSLNGDVDISFPSSAKANLKLQTERGEILSDFDIDLNMAAPEVVKSSDGGMHKIKKGGWTMGKINGGGPEFLMKTMNGDILIRKNK